MYYLLKKKRTSSAPPSETPCASVYPIIHQTYGEKKKKKVTKSIAAYGPEPRPTIRGYHGQCEAGQSTGIEKQTLVWNNNQLFFDHNSHGNSKWGER